MATVDENSYCPECTAIVDYVDEGQKCPECGWTNPVEVLSTLTPREEKVLRMRFGIAEKTDHTLEEVGQSFDVTRERIRQIEAKALRKLRNRKGEIQ